MARGAYIVALAPEIVTPVGGLPAGKPVFWGAGAISAVTTIEGAASEAALMFEQRYTWHSAVHDLLLYPGRYQGNAETSPIDGSGEGKVEPRPGLVVLWVLGIYLVLIIAGGVLVGGRVQSAPGQTKNGRLRRLDG